MTGKIVSWAYKRRTDFTKQDLHDLAVHLRGMDKAERKIYITYLSDFCGFDKGKIYEWLRS